MARARALYDGQRRRAIYTDEVGQSDGLSDPDRIGPDD